MGFRQPSTEWFYLKDAIEKHAINRAPEGEMFTLASGLKSNYYVDMRVIPLLSGTLAKSAGWEMIRLIDADRRYIGAVPTGGLILLPLVLSSRSNQHSGFYVRNDAKKHGRAKQIEGIWQAGAAATFIEDTVTTGGSMIDAIEVARDHGIGVEHAVCLFDREQGGKENLAKIGVELRSVFKASDFGL